MDKNESRIKNNIINLAIVGAIIVGVILFFTAYTGSQNIAFEDHDDHIEDLVEAVDYAIYDETTDLKDQINYIVSAKAIKSKLASFKVGDEIDGIVDAIMSNDIIDINVIDTIVLVSGDKVYTKSDKAYEFLDDDSKNGIRMCTDADGTAYLAFEAKSGHGDIGCYALAEVTSVFARAIPGSLYDDHWVVLYYPEANVVISNDGDQANVKKLSVSEMEERDDGYACIAECERSGKKTAKSYSYDNDGEIQASRIVAFPSEDSTNGVFSISVAVDSNDIVNPARTMMRRIIIGLILFLFSGIAFVIQLSKYRRKHREMAEKIEDLERKNELTEALMEKQKETAHHQRLEQIGVMASGLNHEFNNILTPIISESMLMLDRIPETDEENYDAALEIYRAAGRAKELVARFAMLAHKDNDPKVTYVDPNKVIEVDLKILATVKPKNIEVDFDAKCTDKVFCNETRLSQAFINIILNAFQALNKSEGIVAITTISNNGKVIVSISDNGPGIDKSIIDSVFTPFFTTKSVKGTGLGLAIVKEIIEGYGGTVSVDSELGLGTCFTITLPAADEAGDDDGDGKIEDEA